MRLTAFALALFSFGATAPPAVYRCAVSKKVDGENVYSEKQIRDAQFGVVVRDDDGSAVISRCSFAQLHGRVTCDDYRADHVAVDRDIGVRKYYVFRSQFDVQIFSDLSFVENNGRGGIAYGRCEMTPG